MLTAGLHGGQRHGGVVYPGEVARGDAAALGVHGIEMRQLGRQKSGLQLVQAGVLPLINMVVFVVAAVVAQRTDALGPARRRSSLSQPASAQRPQVLARVEAEPGGIPRLPRGGPCRSRRGPGRRPR